MPKNTPNAKDSAGKAGASAILSADLTMQEERLLLEKLQLDNDEQRARISQLQLQWWQKPFGLLAMILPLVPLMATGVAAIASKWSESQRTAAEVARKEAELEKQGFELENKRLGHEKAKTALENSVLRFEQDQLKNNQRVLEGRVQELTATERRFVDGFFQRYINVCGIGGKLITAHDCDSAEEEFSKFDAFDVLCHH
jgi:hypothetical protein